jgi:prevent-host-death family protein
MKFTSVRELKAKTSSVLRTVKKGDTVLITTHGRPTALVVPVSEDDIEDVLLEHSPVLRQKIAAGLRDIRAGRTVALSDYVRQRARRKARTA